MEEEEEEEEGLFLQLETRERRRRDPCPTPIPSPSLDEAVAIDHADPTQVDPTPAHSYHRFVGRRIRKSFPNWSAEPFMGTVKRFSARRGRNLFHIEYDNGDREDMDLHELLEHLVMDKAHGDPDNHHGHTRRELAINIAHFALNDAATKEGADHIPDSEDSNMRYTCNSHVRTTLDGTFTPPLATPKSTPTTTAKPRLACQCAKRSKWCVDAVWFSPDVQERIIEYEDDEVEAKLQSMQTIEVFANVHRQQFPNCTKQPHCECRTCQYF